MFQLPLLAQAVLALAGIVPRWGSSKVISLNLGSESVVTKVWMKDVVLTLVLKNFRLCRVAGLAVTLVLRCLACHAVVLWLEICLVVGCLRQLVYEVPVVHLVRV